MSRRRWLVSMPASLALHGAGLLLVLLLFPKESLPPAIVLELTERVLVSGKPLASHPSASSPLGHPASSSQPPQTLSPSGEPDLPSLPSPPLTAGAPSSVSYSSSPSYPVSPSPPPPVVAPPSFRRLSARIPSTAPEQERPALSPALATTLQAEADSAGHDHGAGPVRSGGAGVAYAIDVTGELGSGGSSETDRAGGGTGLSPGTRGGGGVSKESLIPQVRGTHPAGAGDDGRQELALAVPGPGQLGLGAEYGSYLARLRHRIQEALRYPPAARRRNLTGTVHMEIVILSNGAIGQVSVLQSSSHRTLDEAAVEAVRSLPPLPFPDELPPRTLRVRLPVVFDLR